MKAIRRFCGCDKGTRSIPATAKTSYTAGTLYAMGAKIFCKIIKTNELGALEYNNVFRDDGYLNIYGWSIDGTIFYSSSRHMSNHFYVYDLLTDTSIWNKYFLYNIDYEPNDILDIVSSIYGTR